MITQKTLNDSVPEGMEVIGSTFTCEKHGDVTQALLTIPYAVKKPGESTYQGYEHYFCLQCLAECFDKMIDEGKLGKLTITQHCADHETAEKYREAIKKRNEQENASALNEAAMQEVENGSTTPTD